MIRKDDTVFSEPAGDVEPEAADISEQGDFPKTRWSLIRGVDAEHTAEAAAALEELCQLYWLPVYVFIRGRGRGVEEAEDLTQEFFAALIARRAFEDLSRERGAFRAFVIAALKRFLVDDWRRQNTRKRGGARRAVAIDREAGERHLELANSTAMDPEKLFERQWAAGLLERVMRQVAESAAREGKSRQFELLSPYLAGTDGTGAYAPIAEALGISEAGARMAMARLRKRFARMLREEIAQTVENEATVDDEIDHLFRVFADLP